MIETLHDANGAGLAAPQIGVLRRVVVINTEGEDWELINPEIVEVSEEEQTGIEGCLSLPGQWGIVTRPGRRAKVRAQDRDRESGMRPRARALAARCVLPRAGASGRASCTRSLPSDARGAGGAGRASCSRSRNRRKARPRHENCLHGNARDREGVPGKALHRGL